MLTTHYSSCARSCTRAKQSGAVLPITLIVLVVMTLTTIALVRSVDTTNLIAGNLAFQNAATHSGDAGIETAIAWMETNVATLQNDSPVNGYSSSFTNPVAGQSWDNFFTTTLAGRTSVPVTDAVGNSVSYAIERLCLNANVAPTAVGAGCTVTPATTITTSSSEDAGTVKLIASAQQYYRITSRIVGPHNAKSYVQAIIAM